jgi:hypothetical protein
MLRAASFTLLVVSILNGFLQAQRATATFMAEALSDYPFAQFCSGNAASETHSLQAVLTTTTASVP